LHYAKSSQLPTHQANSQRQHSPLLKEEVNNGKAPAYKATEALL
jgi:hypothetical protein